MKTIMLLRHAQSSHSDSSLDDFNRPLVEQGHRDARAMGQFVRQVDAFPAYVVSSPAQRAQQTANLFIEGAEADSSLLNWNKSLYEAGAGAYLKIIQTAPDSAESILLIGHNPMVEEVVSTLCNERGNYTARMSPATMACIEHPAIAWEQVKPGTARFQWMMTPDLLHKWSEE